MLLLLNNPILNACIIAVFVAGVVKLNERHRVKETAMSKECQERAGKAALRRQELLDEAPSKTNAYKKSSGELQKKKQARKKIILPEPARFLPRGSPDDVPNIPVELRQPLSNDENQKTEDQEKESLSLQMARLDQPAGTGVTGVNSSIGAPAVSNRKMNDKAVVTRDGLSTFLHIPYLPSSERSAFMIRRLAKEFLPIIKRRGYLVFSVSEMCCCSDGFTAWGGEDRKRNRIKVITANGSEDQCGGYNRTIRFKGNKTMHLIHIRLRDRLNHYKFRSYNQIVNTMCHELAHCIHQNHSPAFYKLMDEIKKEHAGLVASGTMYEESSAEEQFGFDIYCQSISRSRF